MIHPASNKTLSKKITWHLKVFAGAVFVSLIFAIVLKQKISVDNLYLSLILTFLQLEIFIWLGSWFFRSMEVDSPGFKKKIIFRLLSFYVVVLFSAILLFMIVYFINYTLNYNDFSRFFSDLLNREMKGFFAATFIGFALGALFFFYVQWSEAVERVQKLREEKLIFQYETLKNQVNPHFLFNCLNSLSSLIKKDTDLSEIFIQRLSSVYRYIIENREKELVGLKTELDFVQNYFFLQKLRDEEKIHLSIETGDDNNIAVLPVSVQMLVENALKHNAATRSQPLEITIHFEGIDKLVVRNNLQKKNQLEPSSKIGLKNLNERSRLILNREIEIHETPDEFVVKIPVKAI